MSQSQIALKQPQVVQAYTAAEAARELGVTVVMIYRWLTDGTLTEMYLAAGRVRLVSVDSVLKLKAERQQKASA